MRVTQHDRELAEVLVQRDQDAAFSIRDGEYLLVSRIAFPVSRPDHIETSGGESLPSAAPDAGVEKELHADFLPMMKGSMRS